MERLIAWIFEQRFYWFILDNAGALMAVTVLLWISAALIQLSKVFIDENLPAKN